MKLSRSQLRKIILESILLEYDISKKYADIETEMMSAHGELELGRRQLKGKGLGDYYWSGNSGFHIPANIKNRQDFEAMYDKDDDGHIGDKNDLSNVLWQQMLKDQSLGKIPPGHALDPNQLNDERYGKFFVQVFRGGVSLIFQPRVKIASYGSEEALEQAGGIPDYWGEDYTDNPNATGDAPWHYIWHEEALVWEVAKGAYQDPHSASARKRKRRKDDLRAKIQSKDTGWSKRRNLKKELEWRKAQDRADYRKEYQPGAYTGGSHFSEYELKKSTKDAQTEIDKMQGRAAAQKIKDAWKWATTEDIFGRDLDKEEELRTKKGLDDIRKNYGIK